MSAAERQAARRQRQREQIEKLRLVAAEQAKEIQRLQELTGTDEEMQLLIRNILIGREGQRPGDALRVMRSQLMDADSLIQTIGQAMKHIMSEMHAFAIGGKGMKRDVRKEVFAELVKIDRAARAARRSFEDRPYPSPWMVGERYWK
jgi:hypothetical protein